MITLCLCFCVCFFLCSCEDDVLNRKIIESSKYKIEWYTKSGLTKVYPEYVKIYSKDQNKMLELKESNAGMKDMNLIYNDTLIIYYDPYLLDTMFKKKKADTIFCNLKIVHKSLKKSYGDTFFYETW